MVYHGEKGGVGGSACTPCYRAMDCGILFSLIYFKNLYCYSQGKTMTSLKKLGTANSNEICQRLYKSLKINFITTYH